MNILQVQHMSKAFGDHVIFQDFSMDVKEGEFLGIAGKSGSGKSTLLNILGLLDQPDSGDVILFDEKNVKPFSKKAEKLLKNHIGYLFQNFALLDQETVYYNMAMAIEHHNIEHKKEKIADALARVHLEGYEKKKVCQCSGGEQQRIAIARLLIKPCELIMADEPTGSLDQENKELIFSLLKELQQMGKTLVVVSHDAELLAITDRVLTLDHRDAHKEK